MTCLLQAQALIAQPSAKLTGMNVYYICDCVALTYIQGGLDDDQDGGRVRVSSGTGSPA